MCGQAQTPLRIKVITALPQSPLSRHERTRSVARLPLAGSYRLGKCLDKRAILRVLAWQIRTLKSGSYGTLPAGGLVVSVDFRIEKLNRGQQAQAVIFLFDDLVTLADMD
jgi:hypothetical protein